MSKFVQIYGARRSGTVYLQKLVEQNLDCTTIWCNKHIYHEDPRSEQHKVRLLNGLYHPVEGNQGLTEKVYNDFCTAYDQNRVIYLIIGKSPHAWIASMLRYGQIITDQRIPNIKDALSHWNKLYYSWLGVLRQRSDSVFIPYEDIIFREEQYIQYFVKHFGLVQPAPFFIPLSTSSTHVSSRGSQTVFNLDYYKECRFFDELTEEIKDEIEEHKDNPLILSLFAYGIYR